MPEKILGPVVVTGAAGFIGSQVASRLKSDGLILVDKPALFNERLYNGEFLSTAKIIDPEVFIRDLRYQEISWVIHLGAITNTAETNRAALEKWNTGYTKALWTYCAQNKINFIFASSAATYGDGSKGFGDDHRTIRQIKPLNPYGQSKQEFDLWVLEQLQIKAQTPPHWYGLKFFNVYGPNESHKGRMASSIWHGYNEIKTTGAMTLFKSHNPKYKDGEQARDFIFIDDVLQIIDFLIAKTPENDIYNCGTGKAGTFDEVAKGLFEALGQPLKINWIDTPPEFRAAYQYHTQAHMEKLLKTGYSRNFTSVKDGINKYLFRIC